MSKIITVSNRSLNDRARLSVAVQGQAIACESVQRVPSVEYSSAFYWLCLMGSIIFEVAGTSVMKLSQENRPLVGLGVMYAFLGISYFLLAKAVLKLPVGVAYAFWEGIGLVLICLVSILFLGEQLDFVRLTALCMVLSGTLLVHLGTDSGEHAASANHGGR